MNIEQTKNDVMKAGFWVAAILGLLLLALFVNQVKTLFGVGETHTATNTITVSGTGKVTAIPDVATFNFTVTQTAATVVAAQAAASAQLNKAYDALTSAGVASSDIQTLSYNINPHYETQGGICNGVSSFCPPVKSVLTGYDVSQTDQVKVHDLTKAGSLFSTIGTLGVQSVDGLQFSLNDPEVSKNAARALAIADAQTQASKLASELGVKIVAVVGFTEANSTPTPYPMMYAANASMATGAVASPTISTGQQQVTENVSVTYEIR